MQTPNSLNDLAEALAREKAALRELKGDKLSKITWAPVQLRWMNGPWQERILSGGNQIGKSLALLAVLVFHLTGRYPSWYTGPRYDRPVVVGVSGVTARSTRELITDKLFGHTRARGTGLLRRSDFEDRDVTLSNNQVRGQVDEAFVKHVSGGKSSLTPFSYDQGAPRVQGRTYDIIAVDESPTIEVMEEFSQRINAVHGYLYGAVCPKTGDSEEIIDLFEACPDPLLRHVEYYGLNDATWMTEKHRQEVRDKNAGNPFYEATVNGRPVGKLGVLFKMAQDSYVVEHKDFSGPAIIGLDFAHTTGHFAAVKLVKDNNVWVCVREWKQAGLPPQENANAVLRMGGGVIPVSWPHDGGRVQADGTTTAELYRQLGLNMLPDPAYMIGADGARHRSRISIIEHITHMLSAGSLKISEECPELLAEMIKFRFKPGTVQKRTRADDDLIDALFKAVMMLECASEGSSIIYREAYDNLTERFGRSYNLFGRGGYGRKHYGL